MEYYYDWFRTLGFKFIMTYTRTAVHLVVKMTKSLKPVRYPNKRRSTDFRS